MADIELSLWLNRHKADALRQALSPQNLTIEESLMLELENIYNDLVPYYQRQEILLKIDAEQLAEMDRHERSRKFSVFQVLDRDNEPQCNWFLREGTMEFLDVAKHLRHFMRGDFAQMGDTFLESIPKKTPLTEEEFKGYIRERDANTGRVTGAFIVNMDRLTLSAYHVMNGWQTFNMEDISTASYHAFRSGRHSEDRRWNIFLEHLNGLELTAYDEPEREEQTATEEQFAPAMTLEP